MFDMDKLYSSREFAEALSISPRTLRRLLTRGELPHPIKVGGQLRWYAEDVRGVINKPQEG